MNWEIRKVTALLLTAVTIGSGCRPTQPFFFGEDGDLSHYVGKATEIEYPDVETAANAEVDESKAPLTLDQANFDETWPLSLQEAVKHSLANGKVLRSLGGRFSTEGSPLAPQIGGPPNLLLSAPAAANTIFDPAIQESSIGIAGSPMGVEGALSAFDAEFTSGLLWQKNDRPTNFDDAVSSPVLQKQNLGSFQAQLAKTAATGSRFFVRNVTDYNETIGSPFAPQKFGSYWTTNVEAGFNQPLLQGAGLQFNEIAGPFSPFQGIGSRPFDGVVLARLNTDVTLADFENGVQNLVYDVEMTYWELYFAYRNLEARKVAMQSALRTWQRVKALAEAELIGGAAKDEALAREQFFRFKADLQTAKSDLFGAETRLRYMMGIAPTDGRLIRPSDEPTAAKVSFTWCEILGESLERNVQLRRQKWIIKQRELELIAAKNFLLPRLDANGLYRWHGYGHDLINPDSEGLPRFDNAFQTLMDGDFQEWELGLQLSIRLGFRAELADVRHRQLLLTRAKALLEEQELELSHQLADAIRTIDQFRDVAETNFNRRLAAKHQVDAFKAIFDAGLDPGGGTYILDLLLEAQRRLAEAESAYYRSLVDYNRAIATLHLRKGSLLEYNGVYLAEGPWPAKAYFDALRLGRQRDASLFLDYGFTRPSVFSQGPYDQFGDISWGDEGAPSDVPPGAGAAEPVPVPAPAENGDEETNEGRPRVSARPSKAPKFEWGPLGLNRTSPEGRSAAGGQTAHWQLGSTSADEPVANHPSR